MWVLVVEQPSSRKTWGRVETEREWRDDEKSKTDPNYLNLPIRR